MDLANEAPVRPDDFWGEGSAAIHDVLQGPSVDVPADPPVSSGPRGYWAGARANSALLAMRGARRPVALLAGGVAAIACAAFAIGSIEHGHAAPIVRASVLTKVTSGASQSTQHPGSSTGASQLDKAFMASRSAGRHARVARRRQPALRARTSVGAKPSKSSGSSGYAGGSAAPPPTYAATS
ncbi:MAG TPA: hypothetical protein VMP89_09735, partial [Solirubrobacteraceae bacterium]|nr:hypothetical protein [Solirubrobacteraceae bacterium]